MVAQVLRRVKEEDIEALREFWKETPGLELLPGDDCRSLARFIAMNPESSFVIENSGKIIGTVLGGYDGRRGYIYHLAVHPEFRGRGLGKKLLKESVRALFERGALKVHLYVYKDNQKAINFYRHLGWVWREELRMLTIENN